MESLQNINSVLLFKVGPVLCCAPSHPAVSIIIPPKITHPPGTSESMPGIFKHNGRIISLSDLRQKFGIPMDDRRVPGRIIIANSSGQYKGFWVDEILDVIEMPLHGWGMPPAYIPVDIFTGTLFYKDQIWLNTEFEKLLKMNDCGYLQQYITNIKRKHNNEISTETLKPENSKSNTIVSANTTRDSEATFSQQAQPGVTKIDQDKLSIPSPIPGVDNLSTNSQKNNIEQDVTSKAGDILSDKILPDKNINVYDDSPANIPQINDARTRHTFVAKKQDKIGKKEPTASRARPIEKPETSSSPKNRITENQNDSNKKFTGKTVATITTVTARNSNLIPGLLLIGAISVITLLLSFAYERTVPKSIRLSVSPSTEMQNSLNIKIVPPLKNTNIITRNKIKEPSVSKTPMEDNSSINSSTNSGLAKIEDHQAKNDIVATTEYRAVIRKDEDGIVIELDSPITPEEMSLSRTEIITLQNGSKSASPTISNESILDPKSAQNVELIEHIVVKGDTLWDIAKYYVHNPFRYPELARLSNIKNPDLIYPGSRVLIIKHSARKQTTN